MEPTTVSYRNFTSYRTKSPLRADDDKPYQTGLLTHASGKDAVVTAYDYKRRNKWYRRLKRQADMLALIAEKQSRRRVVNATAPKLFTIIDKANRLMLIREWVKGVKLSKVGQGAKVTAYHECIKELARLHDALSPEEIRTIPKLTGRAMKRQFTGNLLRAFLHDRWLLPHLLTLAYYFYRFSPKEEPSYELANRALSADNIICGPDQVYMTNVSRVALAPEGTDLALFPQRYYREVGNDTMKKFLDAQYDTPHAKKRFLHLAAYYALDSEDAEFIPILSSAIAPYLTRSDAAAGSFGRVQLVAPQNL